MVTETGLCEIGMEEVIEFSKCASAGHEEDELTRAKAWDDVAGKELIAKEVHKARKKEMRYVHHMGVYAVGPIEGFWAKTGKGPIASTWLDINKGDDSTPNSRSRWVAKQFKTSVEFELFAETLPLNAI